MAKRLDLPYQSGERTGMQKFKRMRTADCVVGGFRYGSKERRRRLAAARPVRRRGTAAPRGLHARTSRRHEKAALTDKLEKLVEEPGFTGNRPGGPSRWSTERSGEWEPLATKLVVEVQYDHFSGGRFRHGTKFLRWRPDKAPRQCTMEQVERESGAALQLLES